MKITVAIDSLKGSLASMEAGNAAKGGILRVYPEAEVFVRPLADGGEGTVDALTEGLGGRIRTISVSDPLGRPLQADYGILTSPGQCEPLAVIEMAAASGLPLLAAGPDRPGAAVQGRRHAAVQHLQERLVAPGERIPGRSQPLY